MLRTLFGAAHALYQACAQLQRYSWLRGELAFDVDVRLVTRRNEHMWFNASRDDRIRCHNINVMIFKATPAVCTDTASLIAAAKLNASLEEI
jgi:hypothetical protein